MMTDLERLLPADKHDLERAERLVALGFVAVEPIMPQILEWTQDPNWPVGQVLAPFLAGIGAPLAPYVRTVLSGDDDAWKYSLLQGVVLQSPALAEVLRAELTRLAAAPTPGEVRQEVDQAASEVLASLT